MEFKKITINIGLCQPKNLHVFDETKVPSLPEVRSIANSQRVGCLPVNMLYRDDAHFGPPQKVWGNITASARNASKYGVGASG